MAPTSSFRVLKCAMALNWLLKRAKRRQQVRISLNGANWLLKRAKRRQHDRIGLNGANWLLKRAKRHNKLELL